MITSDEVAMKYEAIIRKCYSCDRYDNSADTDIYRHLCSDYFNAIQTDDWTKYQKRSYEVLTAIKNALAHIKCNDFDYLFPKESDYSISLDAIACLIGIISNHLSSK